MKNNWDAKTFKNKMHIYSMKICDFKMPLTINFGLMWCR